MRILIVVTHLLGQGHLARAAALGRAFAGAGHQVRLITGGRPAPTVDVSGLEVVQLPPVHIRGTAFSVLLTGDHQPMTPQTAAQRSAMMCAAVADFMPDAVIIELFPFGRRALAAEFLALLDAAEALPNRPALLCSIRDVLNPPSGSAKAQEALARLARFDRVLVHGDADVLPLSASWPVDAALARRLAYTGYVGSSAGQSAQNLPAQKRAGILVSGGGSAAALPLFEAALGAAMLDSARPWRILVGHGVAEADFAALCARAPGNADVARARADFATLLGASSCSVSQLGYNTALDLAAAEVPAVVVPFDSGGEVEQGIRATRFAQMGNLVVVPQAELTPARLLAAVESALASDRPPLSVMANGAARTVAIVETLIAEKQAEAAAWAALQAALAGAQHRIRLWWRDDDAVAATPALDRLLALAARHALPLALAVIPAKMESSLAPRLAREPHVAVLVHGITHTNHAEAGKKQELVQANSHTLAGLEAGLRTLTATFGPRALPVLVPPWNRVSHDVIAALPALGFAGISTFAKVAQPHAGPLVRADTHFDVIDWHGGGGLASPAILLQRLAQLIAGQDENHPPIGLLTHHLVQDGWVWAFLDRLLALLAQHPAIRFSPGEEVFGLTGRPVGGPKEP